MPRPIHFEIDAEQPERGARFYARVFGWKAQKWDGPIDYWLLVTGEEGEPGIDGGIQLREGDSPGTTNFIGVDSVDEMTALVEQHGGKVARPKAALPGVGYLAYCEDTEGNLFGVMENDPNAQ
jgi:hypothetical protein